jgi:hypothetical protein
MDSGFMEVIGEDGTVLGVAESWIELQDILLAEQARSDKHDSVISLTGQLGSRIFEGVQLTCTEALRRIDIILP